MIIVFYHETRDVWSWDKTPLGAEHRRTVIELIAVVNAKYRATLDCVMYLLTFPFLSKVVLQNDDNDKGDHEVELKTRGVKCSSQRIPISCTLLGANCR